jgi:hypothetical protein
MDGFRKANKVLGAVKAIPAWLRPVIVPGVTSPGDWVVVGLASGRTAYVETRRLDKRP